MTTALRVAGAVVALAAAALLALAAVDVGTLKRTIAADDAQFVVRPARPDWEIESILPGTAVASLVGARDDLAYRQALRRVVLLRERQTVASGSRLSVLVASAEGALLDEVSKDPDPARRAQALNLLGALTVANPTVSRALDSASLSAGADRFQEAVSLDPGNEAARENLELVYRLLRDQGVDEQEADRTEKEGAAAGAGLGGEGGSGY
jgi:hypothetical protein